MNYNQKRIKRKKEKVMKDEGFSLTALFLWCQGSYNSQDVMRNSEILADFLFFFNKQKKQVVSFQDFWQQIQTTSNI